MTREKMQAILEAVKRMRDAATDETALESVDIYPAWREGEIYPAGVRVACEGVLYRCVQAHTSQDDWEPAATPALWVRVSLEEWPSWLRPAGAHDAYNAGDKVSYEGRHYICTADANIYEPGVWGWEVTT